MPTDRRAKKKNDLATSELSLQNNLLSENSPPPLVQTSESSKKSRKKQFSVVASVGPNGIQGNLLPPEIRKPLIAHLPITTKDIQISYMDICHKNSTTLYDPNPPPVIESFNSEDFNIFSDAPAKWEENLTQNPTEESSSKIKMEKYVIPIQISTPHESDKSLNKNTTQTQNVVPDYYKKEQTLLVQFEGSKESKTLPEKSDAACFWCCHTFQNRPCVLPQRDLGSHLIVSGNFCSPECAMAYLFDTRVDSHSRWEQMSLLHRVYSDAVGGRIYPAPSKKILKMFGGTLTIEQYRDNLKSHKYRIDIHIPPMVSILATMDTKPIDFYDASLIKTILDTAQERVAKAEEVLRLKRSKPLKAWESTLDACINLRVSKPSQPLMLGVQT